MKAFQQDMEPVLKVLSYWNLNEELFEIMLNDLLT